MTWAVVVLELGSSFFELARARTPAEVSVSRCECMHDIQRVTSYSEVLLRMEKCGAALGEHVIDTGREVPDITMANGLRRLVPMNLYANLQKMSRIVLYSDAKWSIKENVDGRETKHRKRRTENPPDKTQILLNQRSNEKPRQRSTTSRWRSHR